jgi:hypothetical protein
VREWTATPENLVAEAFDFPSQCKRHPELLCPSASRASSAAPASASLGAAVLPTSHWIAGARPNGPADWTAKDICPDSGGEDVGFRCALDIEAAHSRIDDGQYGIVER